MARVWFSGWETGDLSECGGTTGGTPTVQSTTVRSGNYALKLPNAASVWAESKTGFNLSTGYLRFYVFLSALPSVDIQIGGFTDSTDTGIGEVWVKTDGSVGVAASFAGAKTYGTIKLSATTWYRIELKEVISATVGVLECKVDGTTAVSLTSQNTGSANIDRAYFETDSSGIDVYYDDAVVDNAAYPGAGKIIARQFKSGTPTYDAYTKTGGTGTIDSVWDDTPFNATKFAVSASTTAAAAQTGLTATFASTQTGHGTETIGASDTINAIKIGAIAKCSATTSNGNLGSIRRRFAGADTDTNVTLTTTDAYYETAFFTDTLTNLNASEAGWNKRASTAARTQTVEDVWVLVDYTPVTTQTLTPSLFVDADTFYSPTVSRGTVTLTPSLFTDADTFYAPTVHATYSLIPALFVDADTFYSPTVAPGAVTLHPALFTDADTFFAATVSPGKVTLLPGLYTDPDTFHAPAVTATYRLSPVLFVDPDSFYAPTVTVGTVTLLPSLFVDPDTFYSATVTGGIPASGDHFSRFFADVGVLLGR